MKLSGEKIGFIESKIDEEYLLRAEDIIEELHYSDYRLKGSNDHRMVIADRGYHYDTRVIMIGERIKEGSCNCPTFSKNSLCPHLAASLLIIRKKLNEHQEQAAEPTPSKKKFSRRNSLDSIINELNAEELQNYIREYARQDSFFKLYFLSHFYEHLSEEQVNHLLESVFPPLTKSNEKVSPKRLNNFIKLADILLIHFKSLMGQQNYIDAYDLNFRLLQKSFYIKYNLGQFNEKLLKYHTIFLENFVETLRLIEAPEYKEHIYKELINLLSASYISASLRQERQLWLTALELADVVPSLITICREHLTRTNKTDINTYYFMRFLILYLSKTEDKKEQITYFDQQEIYRIIQICVEFEDSPGSQEALYICLKIKKLNLPVLKIVLLHLQHSLDIELLLCLIEYYKLYLDNVILEYIQFKSEDWQKSKSIIQDLLEEHGNTDALIRYHLYTSNIASAQIYMSKLTSLAEMTRYDQRLAELDTSVLTSCYKKLMDDYLLEHFGLAAQQFVNEVYQRIEKIQLPKVRQEIERYIIDKYKDRSSLN